MFTRLRFQNFLSLKDIEIDLGKVNVLVGPNASGKSNIARAIQLIARHARDGYPLLDGYRSLRELSFNFDPVVNIQISLETLIGGTNYSYTLQLTNECYIEQIQKENKTVIYHRGDSPVVEIKEGNTYTIYSFIMGTQFYSRTIYESMLRALPSRVEREIHHLVSSLGRISVHSFAPGRLRLRNHISQPPLLDYYGENLARYLLYLYTERRKDFWRIEETLRGMVPEVEEVIPHIEGTEVEIWIKIKGVDEPLKPYNISDGTLRLLAIIAALYGGFSLVVLEEPENCIHPHLLEALMYLIRDSPSQVLLTTHSPYLLDYVKPEEVYVVCKEDLETKVKKLSATEEIERVRRFLEEGGTLGEAWYSRVFGGTP